MQGMINFPHAGYYCYETSLIQTYAYFETHDEEGGERRNIFFYNYPLAEIELKTKKTPCQRYNQFPKGYNAGRGNLRTLSLFSRAVHYMHEQT